MDPLDSCLDCGTSISEAGGDPDLDYYCESCFNTRIDREKAERRHMESHSRQEDEESE